MATTRSIAFAVRLVAGALCLLAIEGVALGQQQLERSELIEMRRKAEQFEKEGRYAACGKAYLDAFERTPGAARAHELLYNAGVCLEQAHALDAAIHAYEKLEALAPQAALTRRALIRRALAHEAMAQFEPAAEAYEHYAERFAGEKDAPFALSKAILYQRALGRDREAIEAIELFLRRYGGRRREEAASALFELASIHEKQGKEGKEEKVLQSYKRYLKTVGRSGGLDRLVVANARIGMLLWKRSCRGTTIDGSCVRPGRHRGPVKTPAPPRQCDAPSQPVPTVLPRDRRKVQEARRYLETAVSLAERSRPEDLESPARRARALHWLGAARYTLLEAGFEELLSMSFPKGLDVPPNDARKSADSSKRFAAWLRDITKRMNELERGYRVLLAERGGGAAWAIASSARLGDASLHVATLLRRAAIPPSLRSGPYAEEAAKAYCSALHEQADPIESQAVAAYGFCLETSASLHYVDERSDRCARQLALLRPEEFPLPAEIRGTATALAELITRSALIEE